jgi:uncharacterized membrane protein
MKIRKFEVINFILIIIAFGVAAYIYPTLPEKVASHWDINGHVNGYMSRFWGAFFVPALALGLDILFIITTRIDPKKANIEKFRKSFDLFVSLLLLFVFYIYALTIFFTFGYKFNMSQLMVPAFSVLLISISMLIAGVEPNWSIGIRTPWTLSNEIVWRKTHALGSKLFIASALITLFGFLFPSQAIWFIGAPILLCSFFLVAYSYFEYVKISKK